MTDTQPLSLITLHAEVIRLRAELATLDTVSERRRALLDEKAQEFAATWERAERADAEVARLRAALAYAEDMASVAHTALGCHEEHAEGVTIQCVIRRVDAVTAEVTRLTADRDAWRDALQRVACRLGGTGEGSPDDVRLACEDLAAQDDDRIAAGEDYQRERDEVLALVREHFAAESLRDALGARRVLAYESASPNPHEQQALGREHSAASHRAEKARAALRAKVAP